MEIGNLKIFMQKQLKHKLILFFLIIFLILPVAGQTAFPAPEENIYQDVNLIKESETQKLDLYFFYSESCPHCLEEQKFLNKLEIKYSQVKIIRFAHNDPEGIKIQLPLLKKHNAEKYFGLTPLTFVADEFIPGFDNENGAGKYIEFLILQELQKDSENSTGSVLPSTQDQEKILLPILGEINPEKYSLPVLAGALGLLDGFNVCSLGALIMILGLVLVLKSRKKILIFGGTFILVTAIIYGVLIVLWYKFFLLLSPFMKIFQILIGLFAIGGGVYFLKRFFKFKKQGVVCEMDTGHKVTSSFSDKIKNNIQNSQNPFVVLGLVLVFAVIITIVEFPCSAVIPVAFAGVLAQTDLSAFSYLIYISIFVLFYMLDELIVFLIAVFKMDIWLCSEKFTKWATLIEAIVLILLGAYYLL